MTTCTVDFTSDTCGLAVTSTLVDPWGGHAPVTGAVTPTAPGSVYMTTPTAPCCGDYQYISSLTFTSANAFTFESVDILNSWSQEAYTLPDGTVLPYLDQSMRLQGTYADGTAFDFHLDALDASALHTFGFTETIGSGTLDINLANIIDVTMTLEFDPSVYNQTSIGWLGGKNWQMDATLSGFTFDVAPIPLPAAGILLALAVGALFGLGRKVKVDG